MGLTKPSTIGRRAFNPSPQQADFIDRLSIGTSHIVLEARAGTGKSTTCREGAWTLGDRRSIYCCFNKHIAREFQPGLPRTCTASTLHSIGFRMLAKHLSNPTMDNGKLDRIAETWFPGDRMKFARRAVARMVGACKNSLSDGRDLDALANFAAVNDIRLPPSTLQDVIAVVGDALDECREDTSIIDFDDMIWLPVVLDLAPVESPDVLFVDEAQDLNACQHALVDLLCPTGRIVVVGDEFQSIYAFRGADSQSLPKLRDHLGGSDLGVNVMPLTVTRRCPRNVVAVAQKLVPDIEAHEDAAAGLVVSVDPDEWTDQVGIGDMILCRTNAPLVSACYQLWTAGTKAKIVGKDLGEGLDNLINYLKPDDVGDLIRKVGDYRARELRKLEKLRNPETAAQVVNDRCDCLVAMCKGLDAIQEVRSRIATMFADDVADADVVTLSSIHRSKGLENGSVTILRPDLTPGPWAKDDEAVQQELNLLYVAITRSKGRLTFAGELPSVVA